MITKILPGESRCVSCINMMVITGNQNFVFSACKEKGYGKVIVL